MNTPSSLQAMKRLFSFPFSDPDWKNKFLIGSGLSFGGFIIPILPLLPVFGYAARILRQSAEGETVEPYKLPEWDDWNELFIDGLRLWGASLLVSLPIILIMFAGWGLYMVGVFGTVSAGENPQAYANSSPMFLFSLGAFFCSMMLVIPLSFVTYLLMPVTQAHVAMKRSFGALFDGRAWWSILRANIGSYLLILFLMVGMYMVLMFALQILYITVILCFFMPVVLAPLTFYGLLVVYHLSGLAYVEGQGNLAVGTIGETLDPEPVL